MIIEIDERKIPLKFTYNSFRHMEDLDISKLDEIESKPFAMIPTIEILLYGAMNNNPKLYYGMDLVIRYLEKTIDDGGYMDLVEFLINDLQNSSFFQNLQVEEKENK